MPGRKRQRYIVGVDLGGTKIMVGALSEDGKQHLGMRSIATHAEQGSDVAGEVGHTTIELNGRYCKCGNYGCLEAYASGPAIATRAREVLVREESASSLPSMVGGQLEMITAQTVYDAAKQGDAVAEEIVRDTARYLGAGIASLLNILNPDTVVVAGGVTAAGDTLFVPLRAEVRRRAFRPAVEAVRILPAELPGTAGVVGAVATFKAQH